MRVLLIGGRGFIGAQTRAALDRVGGVETTIAGRRAVPGRFVRIDLNDPSTFSVFNDFDVIINCSDSLTAPSDGAIRHCLNVGNTFIETAAEPGVIERALCEHRADQAKSAGAVLLGMGLFPGVSNLLARSAWEACEGADTIEVGVRLPPLTGAGAGICRLMTDALNHPAVRYEKGRRIEEPAIGPGATLPLHGRHRTCARVGLSEAIMLHYSLGASTTSTHTAVAPAIFQPVVTPVGRLLPRHRGARRVVLGSARVGMTFMRAVLLRWAPEAIALCARASISGDDSATVVRAMRVNHGAIATGAAIAAVVAQRESLSCRCGLVLPDEIFTLEQIMETMRSLNLPGLTIEIEE